MNPLKKTTTMSKKICLLFACAGLIAFTANAQEGKKTKEPVRIATAAKAAPVVQPAPVQMNSSAERAPVAEVTVVEAEPEITKPVVKPSRPTRKPVKYSRANAVATPVAKVGVAK